jgi:hypothetical protein
VPFFAKKIAKNTLGPTHAQGRHCPDAAVSSPLTRVTKPPVCTVLRPAMTRTWPPAPLVPLPTVMATAPPKAAGKPRPFLSRPGLCYVWLEINTPDTPAALALALCRVTAPLVVAVPSPVPRLSAPPVLTVLRRENIWTRRKTFAGNFSREGNSGPCCKSTRKKWGQQEYSVWPHALHDRGEEEDE